MVGRIASQSVFRLSLGLVLMLTLAGGTLFSLPATVLADVIPPPTDEVCANGQLEFGPVFTHRVVRTSAGEEISAGSITVRNVGTAREFFVVQFFYDSGSRWFQIEFLLDPGDEIVVRLSEWLPARTIVDNVIIDVTREDDEYCVEVGYSLTVVIPQSLVELNDSVLDAVANEIIDSPFNWLLPARIDRAYQFMILERPRVAVKQLFSFIALTKVGIHLQAIPDDLGRAWIDIASQTIGTLLHPD